MPEKVVLLMLCGVDLKLMTVCNLVQLLKALSPIVVMVLGRVIVDKKVQFAKAELLIVVTLLGLWKETLVIACPVKAELPMLIIALPPMCIGISRELVRLPYDPIKLILLLDKSSIKNDDCTCVE